MSHFLFQATIGIILTSASALFYPALPFLSGMSFGMAIWLYLNMIFDALTPKE